MILSLTAANEIQAQESQRPEILHLWKKHRTVHIFHRNDSIMVRFNNGPKEWLYLDTLFEAGVFSKGAYIAYQDISTFYIERSSFFYQSIFKPLGGSLMIFGTYIGLNTIGLAINRGFDHPDTRHSARYTFIAIGSGVGLHLWASGVGYRKCKSGDFRISVY